MSLKRTVAPTEYPVSIDEVKDHIRWESTAGDTAQLMVYLRSVVEQMDGAEGLLNRALVTQTWEWKLDRFPVDVIHVPLPPLQSVTSIAYIDTAGVTQTLASSGYKVLNVDSPTRAGLIEEAYGEVWPATRDESEAVTLTFVAGYGGRDEVWEPIRHLLLFAIQDAYDRRSPVDASRSALTQTPAYQGLFNLARYPVTA